MAYLLSKHYQIRCRNFFGRFGELDIIATDPEGMLVFVEVKAYKTGSLVHPLEAISPKKIKRLKQTVRLYLAKTRYQGPCRFDVLVIQDGAVEHLENAILFD